MALHSANNGENKGSLTTTAINIATAAPFTVDVTAGQGTRFSGITTPFYVTLAPALETDASSVEVMEVSTVATDTLTVSARAVNGTSAATWGTGSKIQVRMTGAHIEEIHTQLEALTNAQAAINLYLHNNIR